MRNGVLPKTLHVDAPTRHVDWSSGGVRLLTEATPWPETGAPRRAGVSAFGVSGTNAHVVLEQAPDAEQPSADATTSLPLVPWVLSGRTEAALRDQAARLAEHLTHHPSVEPVDVGLSLATTRSAFEHRAVVLTDPATPHRAAALDALTAVAEGMFTVPGVVGDVARREGGTAFLFTGQGSQRPAMARQLHAAFPAFARALDEVMAELDPHLDRPLREVLFAEAGTPEAGLLDTTRWAQPALFAVEVALFRLLEGWGPRPDALLGHSVGELAAAHVAGVFDLADACALVAARGRLMQDLPAGGAMVALRVGEDEARELLTGYEGRVAVAAVNGPSSVVVSGDEDAVTEIAARVAERGGKTSRLTVSHAFHSPHMDGMLEAFRQVAGGVTYREPEIDVVSDVTGRLAAPGELTDPEYWVRHVRETVRFHDGVRALRARGVTTFVELGPDGVLCGMAKECLGDEAAAGEVALVPTMRRERSESATLLTAVATAHARGAAVDWARLFEGTGARRTPLPTYAFQHRRYWLEAAAPAPAASAVAVPAPDPVPITEAAPSDASMSRDELLTLVRTEAALALGHAGLEDVPADALFDDIGFDSLATVELSSALATATGLTVPAEAVHDHPTPAALADHLAAELAATAGPAGTAAPRTAAAESGLVTMYGRALRLGRGEEVVGTLAALAAFRPTFPADYEPADDQAADDPAAARAAWQPGPVTLAKGDADLELICCAGTAVASGPEEFSALAAALDGRMTVSALHQPGFKPGELLPGSLDVLLDAQADAVLRHTSGARFALLGHSAGGALAHALALRLEERGAELAALVLVDVYRPSAPGAMGVWRNQMLEWVRERSVVSVDDTRLTAMGAYNQMLLPWEPSPTGAPVLFVRASEPVGEWPGEPGAWRSRWDGGEHTAADVPGTHLTMMTEHARDTAATVHAWLGAL